MISSEYEVYYYKDHWTGHVPVKEYLAELPGKIAAKAVIYINILRSKDGRLDEPYARHITGDIRELRVDFAKNRHRIFYFTMRGRRIILLHAFYKKTEKTPRGEISRALRNYEDYLIHETHEKT